MARLNFEIDDLFIDVRNPDELVVSIESDHAYITLSFKQLTEIVHVVEQAFPEQTKQEKYTSG